MARKVVVDEDTLIQLQTTIENLHTHAAILKFLIKKLLESEK